MKNINKIRGKTIVVISLAAVILTVGVVMFAGNASAVYLREAFDGGGGGGGTSNLNTAAEIAAQAKAAATLAGYPKIGDNQEIYSCENGLVTTRVSSCSGTTKIITDHSTAYYIPSQDYCSVSDRACTYPAQAKGPEDWVWYDACVVSWQEECSNQIFKAAKDTIVATVPNSPECAPACTVSNFCGATASGFIVNGKCNAVAPAMPTPIKCGSLANNCSERNFGFRYCGSGSACLDADKKPITKPADNTIKGTACNSAPNCNNVTSQGVFDCNGVCSVTKAPDPIPQPCTSAPNNCGQTTAGTKTCPSDTCSVTTAPPNPKPTTCYSGQNTCGMFTTSIIACPNDACTAETPSDSLCNSCFPDAKPATFGLACRSEANCRGKTTGGGKIGCDGKCNVTPPDPIPTSCTSAPNDCGQTVTGTRACPSDACSVATPPNPANYGKSCTSAPNCNGETAQETIGCDGKCLAVTPTPTPQSCESAPNDCGMTTTGTRTCPSDTCSATTPSNSLCTCGGNPPANLGESCTTGQNKCGMKNTGAINCDGNCSVSAPLDSECPVPCESAANDCGQTSNGTIVNGVCNATTPVNPDPTSCTTAGNACGMTQAGTKACPFSSCLPQVSDSECPPTSCESDPNHCGQTSTGTIVNGVCNATTPSDPQIYIDTGSCTPPVVIGGKCSTTNVDGCLNGSIFLDRVDSNTANLWTCKGLNGGKNALCELPKTSCFTNDTISVKIDPSTSSMSPGNTTSWTWTAKNATWCDMYINNVLHSSGSNMSGTYNSPALFASTTYSIQCINDKCGIPYPTASSTHIANVGGIPPPEITVIPPTNNITTGGQTSFKWTVKNATTCRMYENDAFDSKFIKKVDIIGSTYEERYDSRSLSIPTEYAISCVNQIGPGPTYPTAVGKHNVTITSPPASPPELLVVDRPGDFGHIAFNDFHTKPLTIKNIGGGTLTGSFKIVGDANKSFRLEGTNNSFSLASGNTSGPFNITFSPRKSSQGKFSLVRKLAAAMGLIAANSISIPSSAVIQIDSNGINPHVNENIMGTGVENLSGDTTFDVGDVPVGVTRVFPYPVINSTLDPINTCIKFSQTGDDYFRCGKDISCNKKIESGTLPGIFNIAFSPGKIQNKLESKFIVGTYDEISDTCKRVYDVTIRGNGVKPIATFIEK